MFQAQMLKFFFSDLLKFKKNVEGFFQESAIVCVYSKQLHFQV